MSFELRVFFGARRFGGAQQKQKNTLVFERTKFETKKCLSDINGVGPKAHNNDPHTIIHHARNWLFTPSRRRTMPVHFTIIANGNDFMMKLPGGAEGLGYQNTDDIPFNDYCQIVEESIRDLLTNS